MNVLTFSPKLAWRLFWLNQQSCTSMCVMHTSVSISVYVFYKWNVLGNVSTWLLNIYATRIYVPHIMLKYGTLCGLLWQCNYRCTFLRTEVIDSVLSLSRLCCVTKTSPWNYVVLWFIKGAAFKCIPNMHSHCYWILTSVIFSYMFF